MTVLATALCFSIAGCSHKTRVTEAAETVGNKSAELGAKGYAQVTDKVYDGKVGPNGQTIYIDKDSKYFFINEKGKRVFLKESALRDKD